MDSLTLSAWLQDEPLDPGVMEGIEDIVRRVNNNEAILVTSIMSRSEVLESRMPQRRKKFDNLFKRRNVIWMNHDEHVSELSHNIRNYYDQQGA